MKFYFTYVVDGTYTVEVEAASKEEALKIPSWEAFPDNANFGKLENINVDDLIQIDDENGNTILER